MAKPLLEREKPETRLPKFIRERREALKMTQAELSKKLRYAHGNFITMVENEASRFPFHRWREYANALEVPLPMFLALAIEYQHPEAIEYLPEAVQFLTGKKKITMTGLSTDQ